MSHFWSIHFHAKSLHFIMFDTADTPFTYMEEHWSSAIFQEFSNSNESTLCVI